MAPDGTSRGSVTAGETQTSQVRAVPTTDATKLVVNLRTLATELFTVIFDRHVGEPTGVGGIDLIFERVSKWQIPTIPPYIGMAAMPTEMPSVTAAAEPLFITHETQQLVR